MLRDEDRKKAADALAIVRDARKAGVSFGYLRGMARHGPFLEEVGRLAAPALWIVADIGKADESFGPAGGFDCISLLALRECVSAVVLNEAAICIWHYQTAIARALLRREIVAIVETTERHCADWTTFFEAKRGGPPIMLTVLSPPDGYA
jgi:hypothetical protein